MILNSDEDLISAMSSNTEEEEEEEDKKFTDNEKEENVEIFYSLPDETNMEDNFKSKEDINNICNKSNIETKIKKVFNEDNSKELNNNQNFYLEKLFFKNEIRERFKNHQENNNDKKSFLKNNSKFDIETELQKSIMLRPENSFYENKDLKNTKNTIIIDGKFENYEKKNKEEKLKNKNGKLYLINRKEKENVGYRNKNNKQTNIEENSNNLNYLNDAYTKYFLERIKNFTNFSFYSFFKVKDLICKSIRVNKIY